MSRAFIPAIHAKLAALIEGAHSRLDIIAPGLTFPMAKELARCMNDLATQSLTFRVPKEREIRHYSKYRTRRLWLAAWDGMEANGEFTEMGM